MFATEEQRSCLLLLLHACVSRLVEEGKCVSDSEEQHAGIKAETMGSQADRPGRHPMTGEHADEVDSVG